MQRSMRPSGENPRRSTRSRRLDALLAEPAGHNRGSGEPLHNPQAMTKTFRRTGNVDTRGGKGCGFAGGGTLAAIPFADGGHVSRRLVRAVTKPFRGGIGGSRRGQRGYQQEKTGKRRTKEAKSPTNRSMLLPCCRQTPCLSMPWSRLNILSSGQYVGRIGTVHPQGEKFCEITSFYRTSRKDFPDHPPKEKGCRRPSGLMPSTFGRILFRRIA
jgi:hypothetical protein